MRRLIWTEEAVANLESIAAYIAEFNPTASARFAQRLKAAADSVQSHPDRGREVRVGIRELVIIHPYLIRYRTDEDKVVILRIRHGARQSD